MHRLPKVIRIEKSRKLWINIHHMHIALLIVPYHGFVVIARGVGFDINAQRPIDLQLESVI